MLKIKVKFDLRNCCDRPSVGSTGALQGDRCQRKDETHVADIVGSDNPYGLTNTWLGWDAAAAGSSRGKRFSKAGKTCCCKAV
jgi:hypothetical protein